MNKTKIAVFVSGGGTNLQALIDAAKRGEIPSGEIALVLASNDKAYALTRAVENNIPSAVVKRKDYESQIAYEEAVKAVLAARANHPAVTLANMYKEHNFLLFSDLKTAHDNLNRAVMQAYGFDIKTTTETSCVAELMK
ncbi:MAG: hypothetical protein IKA89_01330, partial [Anaerotignum sp.]|nr:hypothetical protein [Anaerotignum sp.]